jgi:PAS domain S-box-containing protein
MVEPKKDGFSDFAEPDSRQLRKDYIGLTPRDEEILKRLDPLISKHVEELVKGFYRHLLQFDELRQFLSDELITTRLLSAQREYLSTLVGGEYGEAYFRNRFHIGRVHERLKVTPSWYLGAYSRYLSMIFPIVFDAFASSPGKILPAILALTRITFVDIDLAIEAYIQASNTKLAFANAELAKLTQELNRDLIQKTADLKNAQALFRAVFENAGVALFTYKRSGDLLLWNRAFEELFGLDPEEIRGKTVDDALTAWGRVQQTQEIAEIVERVFSGEGVMEILWKIRDRAGNSRHILGSTFPVNDASGDIQFGVWLWIDVTEKKQLREALARTEKLATMGILSSGLAHEIGTPMNVILGRAESLLRHTQEEKTAEGLKIIIEQVERITRLMQHLLAFARRKPIAPRSADLQRILKRVVEMVSEEARKHHVRISMEFESETPLVKIDADQMEQVFINLTMNAIQSMPEGGKLQIRIGQGRGEFQNTADRPSHDAPEIIEIEFKDTGTGIDPEHLGKIFDPFFSTKPVGKGTGLGLAVTQSIIRDHGGEIQVESRVDYGTTFRIFLPMR